jgi:hypothetical protein
MHVSRIHLTSCSLLALACFGFFAASALGQMNVTVDASKPINILTSSSIGVYTRLDDGDLLTPETLATLRAGGLTTLTYPTGWSSTANAYHWSTNQLSAKMGNEKDYPKIYTNPANDFGHFALALSKYGMSAIIHVNYGSNAKGTGGGEPEEAAAWVAYANALPTDGRVIGTDASGQDWKTSGYWATMRASAPLAQDDGYNFLRISHPEPLHIMLWQVGDDTANNGYYGAEQYDQHNESLDMHAPYPATASLDSKRNKARELSPAFYAEQVSKFSQAMKGVDPAIQVGAVITTPTANNWAPDWNPTVLKTACKDIDFAAFPWEFGNAAPPDYNKVLDEPSAFEALVNDLPNVLNRFISDAKQFCPGGKVPRVALSDFAPKSYVAVQHPAAEALLAAEGYGVLVADGISDAAWWQLRDGIPLIGKDNKPTPAYYGVQMLHIVANRPGDAIVTTSGAKGSVVVIGTHRRDGVVGVLLANQDMNNPVQVKVTVNGVELSGEGLRFEYGPAQQAKNAGFERTPIKADGKTVTVSVPAYGLVSLMLGTKK